MQEEHQKSSSSTHLIPVLVTAFIVAFVGLFGVLFFLRINHQEPGELILDDSLSAAQRTFLSEYLPAELELVSDLTISAADTFTREAPVSAAEDTENLHQIALLYDILVPVVDFNDPTLYLAVEDFAELCHSEPTIDEPAAEQPISLISARTLNSSVRLLAVDDTYFLDTYDSGANFHWLVITSENTEELETIRAALTDHIAALPERETVLTFAQTGVTALSRHMYTKLHQVGDANFFSTYISEYLSSFDYTHTSNESSFTTAANASNICSDPAMFSVLTSIGLDIAELTGNHNQDCGDQAAIETIDLYHQHGIQTFGGGISSEAAAIPVQISAKDTGITLLGYNLSTGGYTLDATPGANFYTEEKAVADIAAAKARGDFIIIDIQYYECSEYVFTNENTICDAADSAAGDQITFFRHLIDLGANVVVGTAAHQPQTYERYHDGDIYYGLGNLFFDQALWPGTTRSLILAHYFYQGNLIATRLVPTVYDSNYQTKLMDRDAASAFLERLIASQPRKAES